MKTYYTNLHNFPKLCFRTHTFPCDFLFAFFLGPCQTCMKILTGPKRISRKHSMTPESMYLKISLLLVFPLIAWNIIWKSCARGNRKDISCVSQICGDSSLKPCYMIRYNNSTFLFRFEYLVNTAVRKDGKSKTSWDWKWPLEFILSKQDQEGPATLNYGPWICPQLKTPKILWATYANVWPPLYKRDVLLVFLFFIWMPKACALAVPFIMFVGCIIQILTSYQVEKGWEWKEITGNLKYEQLLVYSSQNLHRAYKKVGEGLFTRACSDKTRGKWP